MNRFDQNIFIEFTELPQLDQLEREWLDLEPRCDCSFFTSWAWIGCWLSCLPKDIRPKLLRAKDHDKTVGIGLFVERNELRHRILPVKSLNLNTTGDPFFDEICIEYNGFLVDRTMGSLVIPLMIEFLIERGGDWDELHINGIESSSDIIPTNIPDLQIKRQKCRYRYVNLDEVRKAEGDYLSFLGHSTRYNIRRSLKEFSKQGLVSLSSATNINDALEYLEGLKKLHQTYWQSRGLPGSFSNSFFEGFHSRLISTRFNNGEIQLIRVTAGNRPIGYLYNFIYRGTVHNYQTGFDYNICKRQYSPGLVTHSQAIEFNTSQGFNSYDLMAGDSQYKQSLGAYSGEMDWVVIQRERLKLQFEEGLRKTKNWFNARLKIAFEKTSVLKNC